MAGGKLKSIGTIQEGTGAWESPNEGANNVTGFSALPAGHVWDDAATLSFDNGGYEFGYQALFWTSTELYEPELWSQVYRQFQVKTDNQFLSESWPLGRPSSASIRCVKD